MGLNLTGEPGLPHSRGSVPVGWEVWGGRDPLGGRGEDEGAGDGRRVRRSRRWGGRWDCALSWCGAAFLPDL